MPNSELIAAAEILRRHAWLERFRKANYENKFNELSPLAANDIARYVDEFLDLILVRGTITDGEK